jgi:hypothetical protein
MRGLGFGVERFFQQYLDPPLPLFNHILSFGGRRARDRTL